MVREALRNYVTLAAGLTDVTRQRAMQAARALAAQGEATRDQVTSLAEDLVTTSRKNREAISTLVRYEVERTLSRVGVATADEVAAMTRRLRALEDTLRSAGGRRKAPAKKSAAKKSTTKKTAAKKSAAKKSTAKKTSAATSAPPSGPRMDVAPAGADVSTAPAAPTSEAPPIRMTPESDTP